MTRVIKSREKSVKIGHSVIKKEGVFTTIRATVSIGGQEHALWYRARSADINFSALSDVFLAAVLIPAMKAGGKLQIQGEVSPALLDSADKVQDIFSHWYPEFQKVKIAAKPRAKAKNPANAVGSFLTGGVDSFYTLLKHRDEISKLVYVHGFDVWLRETEFRQMMSTHLRETAQALGKELIEVETNIHEFSDHFSHWGFHYHGAALASVAMLLSGTISKFYIPSTHTYQDMFPWGSHPLLDQLWSTETVTIVHDGAEADRLRKLKSISKSPVVRKHLRVCLDRTSGAYNCGSCEKCLRTMTSIDIVDDLKNFKTFPSSLDVGLLAHLQIADQNTRAFTIENLRALKTLSNKKPIKKALRNAIDDYDYRMLAAELRTNLKGFLASPYAEGLHRKGPVLGDKARGAYRRLKRAINI